MSAKNAHTLAYGLFWNCLEETYGKLPNTLEPSSSSNTVQTS